MNQKAALMRCLQKAKCYLGATGIFLIGLLSGSLSPVAAGLIAFENFSSYGNNQSLSGGTGGSGWAAGWSLQGGADPTVIGGAANLTFSSGVASSRINRSLGATPYGADGQTTWVRFNGEYFNSDLGTSIGGLSLTTSGSEQLRIGKFSGSDKWSIGLTSATSTTASVSAASDVWVRINHATGNDSVTIWVNPTNITSESNLDGATATINNLDIQFNGIMLLGDRGTTSFSTYTWNFDNIRVGTSFGAMTAVPEPSSLVMVGLLLGGLGVLRRRAS